MDTRTDITNPAFCVMGDDYIPDGHLVMGTGSFGDVSKNLGDGIWCPGCREDGVYSWLEFSSRDDEKHSYGKCPVHEYKYSEVPTKCSFGGTFPYKGRQNLKVEGLNHTPKSSAK